MKSLCYGPPSHSRSPSACLSANATDLGLISGEALEDAASAACSRFDSLRVSSMPKVLVADDDEAIRHLHCWLLTREGYSVKTAADGEEAWDALLLSNYDLLLTDHNMPRLSGLDLVARLRAAGMTLPVIIDSGSPELEHAALYPHLGLTAVLHKGSDYNEVLEAVKHALPTATALVQHGTSNTTEEASNTSDQACR